MAQGRITRVDLSNRFGFVSCSGRADLKFGEADLASMPFENWLRDSVVEYDQNGDCARNVRVIELSAGAVPPPAYNSLLPSQARFGKEELLAQANRDYLRAVDAARSQHSSEVAEASAKLTTDRQQAMDEIAQADSRFVEAMQAAALARDVTLGRRNG